MSDPLEPGQAVFVIGKYEFGSNGNLTKVGVKNFIMHPTWDVNDPRYDGDIALAVLERDVEFFSLVQPVCLNVQETLQQTEGMWTSWTLHVDEISVPFVNHVNCLFSHANIVNLLPGETAFCAGKRDGEGFCKDG